MLMLNKMTIIIILKIFGVNHFKVSLTVKPLAYG